ncbi:hypothetical protein [Salinibacterium sp. NK8237]|uniref:hypothetical protein n=1 Tax=Salinibacterium sp. NK8237 TaxID=2792038 RepID=UPI0018CF356E|nr:hypothetical protein [Salinibacterium sp. NK8237]MBH0129986.1 hypothetical protein [Salinibacterium sp. NK8237]
MYQNPGPGNYAHAKGRAFEFEAQIAAAVARGDATMLAEPERPYNFRRGLLFALLTIPSTVVLVAVFGLNSPTAGIALTPLAVVVAFGLFSYGSGRRPVTGRGFTAATGIGLITMIAGAVISTPYSRYLTYLYNDGSGSILSSDYANTFAIWVNANVGTIVIPSVLVTIISVVIVWRKARAARSQETT